MILEAIVNFFAGVVEFFLNLLPSMDPPGFVTGFGEKVSDVLGYASGLGAWLPLGLVATVTGALIVCIGVGFGIKVVRIVASFFTAGGGSAA